MTGKSGIRAAMRLSESSFPAQTAGKEALAFWREVETLESFRNADTVLLYMSIDGEIPTAGFIDRWFGRKRIAVPVVRGSHLELREYKPGCLTAGYKGIPEPTGEAPLVNPEEIGIAIIPGVAFARDGKTAFKRLGRGKGFYDRLLPSLRCPCIPSGFSFRFLEDIPTDSLDAVLHTETEFSPYFIP